jgi:hypothetical protein
MIDLSRKVALLLLGRPAASLKLAGSKKGVRLVGFRRPLLWVESPAHPR